MMIAAVGLYSSCPSADIGLAAPMASARFASNLPVIFWMPQGAANWHTYFHDIELDRARQDYNHPNFDNMTRAVFREKEKGPIFVLSTRKPNDDNWFGSNPFNEPGRAFFGLGPAHSPHHPG